MAFLNKKESRDFLKQLNEVPVGEDLTPAQNNGNCEGIIGKVSSLVVDTLLAAKGEKRPRKSDFAGKITNSSIKISPNKDLSDSFKLASIHQESSNKGFFIA